MSYKKVKTVVIFDKPKCIYMKPKGTREYVKSKGEMVLLSAYIKKAEKIAAKKALASKMAKKSKASRSPMKRRSVYGGDLDDLNWKDLSKNINEIELLRNRIEYEKKLTQKEYEKLDDTKKIDWGALSRNQNAIELLRENQDKIDWGALSSNPNAIELLRAKSLTNKYTKFK